MIFKLQLIKGKCLVFVGDIDRCYRLKLFLEQFGIKSCILNSELPVNSRIHVVQEFNKGVYDIIIAADDKEALGSRKSSKKSSEHDQDEGEGETLDDDEEEEEEEDDDDKKKEETSKRQKLTPKEKDYGISRGIDFQNVACVLNFDLPRTSKSYTHRIGRTGRAGKPGMALSFIIPPDQYGKHKPTSYTGNKNDEKVLKKITTKQTQLGNEIKPYHFEMKHIEAFRYRMSDALRSVTRLSIQEARAREIRQELIKSDKLKKHFDLNPIDLSHLRHDDELRSVRVQPHLKHVPDYLMPAKGKSEFGSSEHGNGNGLGFVGFGKSNVNRIRKVRDKKRGSGKRSSGGHGKVDPLKTFNRRKK